MNATDGALRAQYLNFPYPKRDPADERRRLITGSPSHIEELREFVFGGAWPARVVRALFAGGGTGDGMVMLAQQARDAGHAVEIVHLDVSPTAQAIAAARLKTRGLAEARFVEGSLLDLPSLALGAFDYIDCCGVLHHLADPEAGLAALATALAPGGGIGLMVYAPHGRDGVYPLQAVLRRLAGELSPHRQVALARHLLASLPATHAFKRNPFLRDHLSGGDAGLYDLLLCPRDRAYSVRDLDTLIGSAGLAITQWVERLRYDPALYLPEGELRERARALGPIEAAALAEDLAGNMGRHIVYVARPGERLVPPDPSDPAIVPVPRDLDLAALAQEIARTGALRPVIDGFTPALPLPRLASAILPLIDGARDLGEIHQRLIGTALKAPDLPGFVAAFAEIHRVFGGLNRLHLRRR